MNLVKKPSIVVAGYIVCGPIGGLVWHHLQYVLGLQRLGYDVLFVEDSHAYPACYHPTTFQLSTDPSYGLNFIQTVFDTNCLGKAWAYFDYHTNQWFGKTKSDVDAFVARADIYMNLSGVDPLRETFQNIPVRVFIDTDPAFTQIRHLTQPDAMIVARRHNRFFSFGEKFGQQDCSIPNDGFAWLPTRQPVVINAWPRQPPAGGQSKWTTVMQWDSYRVQEYGGKKFGMKSLSFDEYLHLPEKVNGTLELALGSTSAPREKLLAAGWSISDPLPVSITPESYRSYIAHSKGEWSVAKHGYASTNSGWFSERSCGYLASAKPVVVQDTGFSTFLPTGKGLLAFTNLTEAAAAIDAVNQNYHEHCRQAREIAEECFGAEQVLNHLLNRL